MLPHVKRILKALTGSIVFYIVLSIIIHFIVFRSADRVMFGPPDTGLDRIGENRIIVSILGGHRKKKTDAADSNESTNAAGELIVEKFTVSAIDESLLFQKPAPPVQTNAVAAIPAATNETNISDITGMAGTNAVSNVSNTNRYVIPFDIGETIVYEVEVVIDELPAVRGVVGMVSIELTDIASINGRRVFVAQAETSSLEAISDLYTLHDVFYSWFDAQTFQTYKIEKKVREGQYFDYVTNIYYSDKGYGIYYNKNSPDGRRYEMASYNSYDIITLLYLLRVVDKTKPFILNWVADRGEQRELNIVFHDEGYVDVAMKGKFKRVDAITAKDVKTGITIYLAKQYGFFPVKAVIPAFKLKDYTITVVATLKKYTPGRKGPF